MALLNMSISTTANRISTHSTAHNLPSKGINFLKIRSEMKAIIAVNKHKPAIKLFMPDCTGTAVEGLINIITPATRHNALTIFKGVSFNARSF